MQGDASEVVEASRKWSITVIVLGFWTAALASSAVAQIALALGPRLPTIVLFFVTQSVFWAVLITTALVSSRRSGVGNFRTDFGIAARRSDALVGLTLGVVFQFVGVAAIYAVIGIVFENLDVSGPAKEVVSNFGAGWNIVVLALGLIVIAPFVEEVFFRGLVFRALGERYGDSVAVWGSAIAFGVSHLQVVQAPALIAFGLLLAILVRNTGRLGPAFYAHAGFNAVTVLGLILSR